MRTYRPFSGFWSVKNLSELADEPTLYVGRRGEGVFSLVRQSPISVVEHRLAPCLPLETVMDQNLIKG